MEGYVCVYRQPVPDEDDLVDTTAKVADRPELGRFLSSYQGARATTTRRFYDWGDDPSFFCAEEFLGDVRLASWGVCRPDLRARLRPRDFVVFFCAQQDVGERSRWHYYFIGVGTVAKAVAHRSIWRSTANGEYREFYNLLIDAKGNHHEVIQPAHSDWKNRTRAPYVLFKEKNTDFNVTNPLFVATYESKNSGDAAALESWHLEDSRVREVYKLIPTRGVGKKLRTSPGGFSHQYLRLSSQLGHRKLRSVRRTLLRISRETRA